MPFFLTNLTSFLTVSILDFINRITIENELRANKQKLGRNR